MTHNHNYCFENDPKRLHGIALSNQEIVSKFKDNFLQYRIHLLPRSYETTIPEGKTDPFKLTSKYCYEFDTKNLDNLMTKNGQSLIQNNKNKFEVGE